MQNLNILMDVFSSIQNVKKIQGPKYMKLLFWALFELLRPKSKMQNDNYVTEIFGWCLILFCRMWAKIQIFLSK